MIVRLRDALHRLLGRPVRTPGFEEILREAIEIYGTAGLRLRAFERERAAQRFISNPQLSYQEKEINP